VVDGDGSGSEEDQSKSQRGCGKGELISMIARQAIMQVHLPDRDAKVNANGERGDAGEKASQEKYSAEEFGERGNVTRPGGQAEAGDKFGVVMQASENFVSAVHDHNGTQGKSHDKKRKWLQTFEVAQGSSAMSATRLPQKSGALKRNQQNDCVADKVLVTFFRPPSESQRDGEIYPLGLELARCSAIRGG
jgi:hypothetical protein